MNEEMQKMSAESNRSMGKYDVCIEAVVSKMPQNINSNWTRPFSEFLSSKKTKKLHCIFHGVSKTDVKSNWIRSDISWSPRWAYVHSQTRKFNTSTAVAANERQKLSIFTNDTTIIVWIPIIGKLPWWLDTGKNFQFNLIAWLFTMAINTFAFSNL